MPIETYKERFGHVEGNGDLSVPITASFESPIFPSMPFEIPPPPKIYGFGPVSRPRVRGKINQKKGVI